MYTRAWDQMIINNKTVHIYTHAHTHNDEEKSDQYYNSVDSVSSEGFLSLESSPLWTQSAVGERKQS